MTLDVRVIRLALALALAGSLMACSGVSSSGGLGEGDPATVVQQYLQAKIQSDKEGVRRLLCSAMEADLDREANAFTSVTGVTLEGVTCARDGSTDVVRCQGKIVAEYGTEKTEFSLGAYRVVQEDGEWKWCGETA